MSAPRPKPVAKSNPIPGTLSTIRGYPDRLKIYRIPASPFWWCRATLGERRVTRSTKETERRKAETFAKDFYNSLLQRDASVPLKTSRSFERCARLLLEEHKRRTTAGERNPRFADDLRKQLTHRIIPFFKSYALKDIDYQAVSRFVDSMRDDKASAATIKATLVSVRQVLKHASKLNLIDKLPLFPVVTVKDNPRTWFNEDEYAILKVAARKAATNKVVVKGELITREVRDFIVFMVNTFLRPSDWYKLRRRHVRIQERANGDKPILVLSPPSSKTVNSPIVSMPYAVPVYRNIIKRQDKDTPLTDEAFVFLPHIANRNRAQALMGRFFDYVVREAGLKTAHTGDDRTMYSLRHTAIAFRLLKGENVDLLFLARNCRTSVDIIDRFYCRHLSALMAPEKIVGMRQMYPRPDAKKDSAAGT